MPLNSVVTSMLAAAFSITMGLFASGSFQTRHVSSAFYSTPISEIGAI